MELAQALPGRHRTERPQVGDGRDPDLAEGRGEGRTEVHRMIDVVGCRRGRRTPAFTGRCEGRGTGDGRERSPDPRGEGRTPEPVALGEGHAELSELAGLGFGLDALGDEPAPVLPAKWTMPGDERLAGRVAVDARTMPRSSFT